MLVAVALVASRRRCGPPITVKLATQAPVNSSWHKALLDMGAEWEAKTAGRVKLTVYAGGTQGSEDATIRMMRPGVDQLQANLLMLPGLAHDRRRLQRLRHAVLLPDATPKAQHVLEKLTPMLEKRLEAKGFKLLAWGSAGWVQLFSKKPLTHARRRQGGQALHEPGRRPDGAVVQGQRLPPGRADRRRHPGAAQAHAPA